MKNRNFKDSIIFVLCLVSGMLFGRIVLNGWNSEIDSKVEQVLSQVIMMDVPMIDEEASLYLRNNDYKEKYLTTIDISDNSYGIYRIENNDVTAYAHGKCLTTGDAQPGTYRIVKTKSHLDYNGVRYWRVIELEEIHTHEKLIVSTPGYEIAEAPIKLSETKTDLGNVQIGQEIMLSVYENGSEGTILLIIDGETLFDGTEHLH